MAFSGSGFGTSLRFGFVIFGSSAQVVFKFDQYTQVSQLESAFASVKLVGGGCAAGAALTTTKSSLFASAQSGAAMVLVVMIAGKSTDDVAAGAGALKEMGVKTIAFGMGESFEQSQLTTIAFQSSYVLTATAFGGLSEKKGSLPEAYLQVEVPEALAEQVVLAEAEAERLESAFASVKLVGGGCAAGAALTTTKSSLFASAQSGAAMVLVVMIAGKSTDDVAAGAGALKEMGVKTIAFGMGESFEQSQLTTIAFQSSYVLTATAFGGLSEKKGSLVSLIGSGSCDLGFMLDTSSSISGEANFKLALEFIVTVFQQIGMTATIRFGFMIFGSSSQVVFDFTKFSSFAETGQILLTQLRQQGLLNSQGEQLGNMIQKQVQQPNGVQARPNMPGTLPGNYPDSLSQTNYGNKQVGEIVLEQALLNFPTFYLIHDTMAVTTSKNDLQNDSLKKEVECE
ncbi:predicted protein [Nematostella vectensis]|uniref:VWFA domain-containing protein n=1 Tax=Nematostella vectensis TaxID=45351 RepID=A7T672_NEMVE|nr:predicted protein [Nematostella vectensis]|eukprot:XP_001620636.1 hypothetical protein NEMVEDRAFT_v1g222889 [Nematostella vectensis]